MWVVNVSDLVPPLVLRGDVEVVGVFVADGEGVLTAEVGVVSVGGDDVDCGVVRVCVVFGALSLTVMVR